MRSIKGSFRRNMMLIAVISTGALFFLWMHFEYRDFLRHAAATRLAFESNQKELIRREVTSLAEQIEARVEQTEEQLRLRVRARVDEAFAIATTISTLYGADSPEAREIVREVLRNLRFDGGRGYFFAFNLDGVEELFADRPEMEGKNMLAVTGGRGEFVVQDMLEKALLDGSGYYEYTWSKPGSSGNQHPKIAYIRLFAPFGWVIGSGEYIEDNHAELQDRLLSELVERKFGEDGYFFGSIYGGQPLFTNGTITRGSQSIRDLTDPDGVRITEAYQQVVDSAGGGYVRYSWRKPNSSKPSPKVSYVVGIPRWQWIIGAGIYLDTIEEEIVQRQQQLLAEYEKKALVSFAFLCGVLLLIFFWATRISGMIQGSLATLVDFFHQGAAQGGRLDPASLPFEEFQAIARSTNSMLEEHRTASAALAESEGRYRTLFENMAEGVFFQDADGRLSDINRSAQEILGLTRAGVASWQADSSGLTVVGEDGRPLAHAEHPSKRALFSGRPVIGQIVGVFNAACQENRWLLINATPRFRVGESTPFQVIVTLQDITERQEAEQALRESEQRTRVIFEKSPLGIIFFNPDGTILDCNPQLVALMGSSREKLLHFEVSRIADPLMLDAVRQALSGQPAVYEDRYTSITGGVTRDLRILFNPIQPGSNPTAVIATYEDISERREAEEARRKLEGQLLQAQKMEAIGTLAGGIAHDFNNMLSAILGYADMARASCGDDSPVADDLEQILKASRRARDLVKQILAFSRQVDTVPIPLYPAVIVKEVVRMVRPSLPSTIDIAAEIDEQAGPVLVDPTQLHQIILNLCSNASHAMEAGSGTLTIGLQQVELARQEQEESTLPPGNYVRLRVADNGSGISPEVQKRMFDPFFTTKEVGRGTGMGLATVHGIVKSCGGAILCRSRLGEGTSFAVFLPVTGKASLTVGEERQRPLPTGGGRILLVDDEEILVDVGLATLARLGYQATVQTSARAALALFEADPAGFDAVITDQTMPEMTGMEMARRMLAIRPDLPIILCTGFSTQVSEEQALAEGVRAFALKPLTPQDLGSILRRVLDRPSSTA